MRFMMRTPFAVATLGFTVILACCNSGSVRQPLRRSQQYRAVVADYKTATVLPSEEEKEYGNRVWKQPLPADSPVKATVTGSSHMDIIQVSYPDESEPRRVYPPADYTNNIGIRVKGATLYVYRAVTLFWTEYRLGVYDLANRKMQVDLLVAPEDMPPRVEGR
jgi:hypothetical protein